MLLGRNLVGWTADTGGKTSRHLVHDRTAEQAKFPRREVLIVAGLVGQTNRMVRNRIVSSIWWTKYVVEPEDFASTRAGT